MIDYFNFGIFIAIVICTILLALPFIIPESLVKSLYKITEGKGVLGNLLETIIHKDRYYNDRYTYAVLAFYIMYMLTVYFLWFCLIISWPLMVPLLVILILFFKKLKLT